MSWNYRVIETIEPGTGDAVCLAIHEVHYDENGSPVSYAENPAYIAWAASEKGITPYVQIAQLQRALALPILHYSDFRNPRSFPRECRACREPLLIENVYCDDGCPCNSPRGVNFKPQACERCRTDNCVKPGHRLEAMLLGNIVGPSAAQHPIAKQADDGGRSLGDST